MNPTDRRFRGCIAAATDAVHAAQAIAADPACAPRSAAAPLVTAWDALGRATGSQRDADEPEAWLPASVRLTGRALEAQRRELATLRAEATRAPEEPSGFDMSRTDILAHAARLTRLITALRGGEPLSPASPWPRRLAAAAYVALFALLIVRPWRSESIGPWRGVYFSRPDLTGATIVHHDLDLRFDWGRDPPLDAVPANRYGVRWDTCLTLDEAGEVSFQLTSDNRAKLLIDDRAVLTLNAAKKLVARGTTIKLAAGVHHLQVEYRKTNRESHLGLTASLDGEAPRSLPFSRLSAPRVRGEVIACD